MTIEPLVPDQAPLAAAPPPSAGAFAKALDAIGSALDAAAVAEDAFARGRGSLQQAVYERARADAVLTVATATAQRSAQAVQNVLNMQV